MAFLLSDLLSESAARDPNKVAARFNSADLTYAELDTLTNQVALMLQDLGIKRGDRVGLYVNKSFASLIGVFGIMKAGAAYVPLDPSAPVKRLSFITRNCDIKILLTAANKLKSIPKFQEEAAGLTNIVLLEPVEQIPDDLDGLDVISWHQVQLQDSAPPPEPGTIETDLAYILYTSGSTGAPKGVMISHRTILTFINWCFETFKVEPSDRATSHAPLHFDLSTFDIYVTIKAGATVVLIPERASIFPVQLSRLLADEKITITYMVPSILTLMVNYGKLDAHDLSHLRTVLFAGEVFPIKFLREFVNLVPAPAYYNLYGPTETNVCTYYKVEPQDLEPEASLPVPIGKACENMGVFVLDETGQQVTQPGVEGELWARGSCVAQGYWGDLEKTASRFVANPLQPNFQEPAYRTGDIVVLDEDGINWRFSGRRDHMIKSRGYRIELGEIETALYAHAGVKEAAVIAVPDPIVTNRLKAFVVLVDGSELDARQLQSHCSQHVPRYMIPESIDFMEALPKTSTGKVNRVALQDSEAQESV
jgi:amino acid adenylation domain-containing protein